MVGLVATMDGAKIVRTAVRERRPRAWPRRPWRSACKADGADRILAELQG